ncbi:H-type lectin domain-containing protein [Thalassovita taeanensis]|uniref:H-type lectin domain-containing protein n=1 Tax=Thalassovita taeanensis TaxID=657014 RepID=A0A1H9I3T1_9RHOB|nr:H-type lectin domain-containing protein [Thalassovita taeanensis]SEQ69085.1 H-type lectin domain-containing protein [Thalassovita taeanensis]
MKRLKSHLLGVDQGEEHLFSDFEDGGEMWTGTGARERRRAVKFSESFRSPPTVMCSVSLWDVDYATNIRSDLTTDAITETGFEIVFRTWGNTRLARTRISWIALGELCDEDDWDLY